VFGISFWLSALYAAASMPSTFFRNIPSRLREVCPAGDFPAANKLEQRHFTASSHWRRLTACRVMAKRFRVVCGLPEDEELWKAGRGFVVRDLPWPEDKLRIMPPFEFENWAVIALGGIPNKTQVGDMGIDGRIYPVSSSPEKRPKTPDTLNSWIRGIPFR
jgi:hypothetical protein